jgi:hypothetical protein
MAFRLLAQASDGSYDPAGKTLFFTRLPFLGSHTPRCQGGTDGKIVASFLPIQIR